MGHLTTHVLDVASGRPAAGIGIELYALDAAGSSSRVTAASTNGDGRTDAPLLAGEDFVTGVWQLEFIVGEYFTGAGHVLDEPPFLDRVVLRFGVCDAQAHYHVPLLVSPWSYSTYRGS